KGADRRSVPGSGRGTPKSAARASLNFSQEGAEDRKILGLGVGSEGGVGGWVVTAKHVAPVEIDSDQGPTTSVPLPHFRPFCDPSPSQTRRHSPLSQS